MVVPVKVSPHSAGGAVLQGDSPALSELKSCARSARSTPVLPATVGEQPKPTTSLTRVATVGVRHQRLRRVPKLPWRHLAVFRPHPHTSRTCLKFCARERWICLILGERPGHARLDHRQIGIRALAIHSRHSASVTVLSRWANRGLHLIAEAGEVFLAASTKRLPGLGCVYFSQPAGFFQRR